MVKVPLSQGYEAIVDDEDAWVLNHSWHVSFGRSGIPYASCTRFPREDGKGLMYLHRAVLRCKRGDAMVDHIDGNGLDCRKANLRKTSGCINQRNVSNLRKNNTSGYHGVSFNRQKQKWCASIIIDRRTVYLGQYATAELANEARLRGEKAHWGVEPRRQEAHAAVGT